jgi:hypothetical protein
MIEGENEDVIRRLTATLVEAARADFKPGARA